MVMSWRICYLSRTRLLWESDSCRLTKGLADGFVHFSNNTSYIEESCTSFFCTFCLQFAAEESQCDPCYGNSSKQSSEGESDYINGSADRNG
jgi:hypothetical protein